MATRAYRLPRRYRYRPRGSTRTRDRMIALGAVLGLIAAVTSKGVTSHGSDAQPASSGAAVAAISYAQAQIGKPYLWGGTGPDAFDCSGLAMMAYRAAGVTIARTSQEQWASERHIPAGQVRAGDLVYFHGLLEPGEQPPGHVGIVTDPARHLMVDAYGTGTPVGTTGYGPAATLPGLGEVVGYTQPWGS